MRQINTEELKKIQLDIFDVVTKFCDEHDILCFPDGGTLLGTVRHKGFIPWDDDIDLAMLRPDYDRFMKLFNGYNTRYSFHCAENDPEYISHCGKVFDNDTICYIPNRKIGYKSCINVEIYVLDNAPDDDKALRKMRTMRYIYWALHRARYMPAFAKPNGNIFRKIAAYVLRISMNMIPVSILPRNYFARKMVNNSRQYIAEKTKRVGNFVSLHTNAIMDRSKFENFIYAEFEGRKIKIPSGYDEWLTKLYGDYMTPPPESKRASIHHFEAFVNN